MKNNRRESDSVQLHFPFFALLITISSFYQRNSSPIYWVAIPNNFTLPDMVYTIPSPLGDGIELRTLVDQLKRSGDPRIKYI